MAPWGHVACVSIRVSPSTPIASIWALNHPAAQVAVESHGSYAKRCGRPFLHTTIPWHMVTMVLFRNALLSCCVSVHTADRTLHACQASAQQAPGEYSTLRYVSDKGGPRRTTPAYVAHCKDCSESLCKQPHVCAHPASSCGASTGLDQVGYSSWSRRLPSTMYGRCGTKKMSPPPAPAATGRPNLHETPTGGFRSRA